MVSMEDDIDMFDKEINQHTLGNPYDPLVVSIMYLYSLETFLPHELNKASETHDISKIDTLGPFAAVLNHIMISTNFQRDDAFHRLCNNDLILWRPTVLKDTQIEYYYASVHKRQRIQLGGYISTSKDRDFALKTILSEELEIPQGSQRVLFQFTINQPNYYYEMDSSLYSEFYDIEKEVLLRDGLRFKINDIMKVRDE